MSERNKIGWYQDRDFPEIKSGNDDIVAVVPDQSQRERIIHAHNDLVVSASFLRTENTKLREEIKRLETTLSVTCVDATVEASSLRTENAQLREALGEAAEILDWHRDGKWGQCRADSKDCDRAKQFLTKHSKLIAQSFGGKERSELGGWG